ncbi:MAG: C45 family autoproteolytic acyltransferase/hydrolase [Sphingobacterium sp.]
MTPYSNNYAMLRGISAMVLAILLASCGSIRNIHSEIDRFEQEFDTIDVVISGKDRLSRSPHGNWQLQVTGHGYGLGYKKGLLTKDLFRYQEWALFQKVSQLVPRQKRQRFLLQVLKWYHRSILNDIPLNYRKELYGLSIHAGDQYENLGNKYERSLLLHGAHDIGHAMQDLMLVGCSSVALWGSQTPHGELLIGRNFDFYVNEEFAKNKVVEFIEPSEGYKYAAVSWAGMIGVVSGMNEKGLTITLNAGKSSTPLKGKTPISIVARDILQQAKNIEEAIAIAQTFEVFISESLLIGSAEDNRAITIEISPKKMDVFEVQGDQLLCTNHFQSPAFQNDRNNREHIATSHSQYRMEKLKESFSKNNTYGPMDIAKVLRDETGKNRADIGLGNEKALNQLLAHHAVIFSPSELIMWVANSPYQLGAFEAYDLHQVFNSEEPIQPIDSLELPPAPIIHSQTFKDYLSYKAYLPKIDRAIETANRLPEVELLRFEQANPNLWLTHKYLGDYFYAHQNWEKSIFYYELALSKEVSSEKASKQLEKRVHKLKRKYGANDRK